MKRYVVIAIFFILFFGSLGAFFLHGQSKTGHPRNITVVLGENGFVPSELALEIGDSITFTTTRNKNFWPASDPHPVHNYLPGFDPGRAIEPQSSFTETFTSLGTWRYHDHLDPSIRGTVNVLNHEGALLSRVGSGTGYCDGQCFDELIRSTVATKGIEAAYALFSASFEAGKLPRSCHWTAHQIGEAAYELFREHKDFPISRATAFCGYGFYHGFLESLLRENPDTDSVLLFCDRVRKELGNLGLWNCYHGIGHGFTEDPPDPKVWGNFQAMLDPGIKMCEFLFSKNFRDLNLCLTGVFTVPAGFAEHNEYGLSFNPKDPWAYCAGQPYRYHKACYGEFTPKLASDPKFTLDDLPPLLQKVTDAKTTRLIVWVAPSVLIAKDILNVDFTSYVKGCRNNFSGKLREICYGGVIQGIFTHGEPEKQYTAAFRFCDSTAFSQPERDFCYAETLRQVKVQYEGELSRNVCASMEERYRKYCLPNAYESPYDDPSFDEV